MVAIWPRYDQSAMFATISICDRILRLLLRLVVGHRTIGGTRGRAITNDWRRSIARSIVGNRATSGGDQRPIVRSIVATCDRSHDRSQPIAASREMGRSIRYKGSRSYWRLLLSWRWFLRRRSTAAATAPSCCCCSICSRANISSSLLGGTGTPAIAICSLRVS